MHIPNNKEIAGSVGSKESTYKGWKTKAPELYKTVKIGAYMRFNNIEEQDLKSIVLLNSIIKNKNLSYEQIIKIAEVV